MTRSTRSAAISLAAVFLAPLILLAPALGPGRVLSSADMVMDWHLFWSAQYKGYTGPRNGLIGDPVMQLIPARRLASDEIRAGRLPFWNPHAYAGAPLLGNSQSGVFDPLGLPYLLTHEPDRASVWVALLRLWVAGAGVWLLVRRLGGSLAAAALGGIAYSCGGFMVVWLLFPLASSGAWFPWAIFAAEGLASTRSVRAGIGVALALAASALGGQVEVAFFAAVAVVAYVVTRAMQLGGKDLARIARTVALLCGAGVLCAALSAIHVLPFLEALSQGSLAASREYATAGATLPWLRVPGDRLALLLFPYLYGRPVQGEVNLWPASANFCEASGAYLSLLGLGLAVLGTLTSRRCSPARVLAPLGTVAWLYSVSFTPLYAAALHVPAFRLAPPQRCVFVALLAGAVLAGLGVDALVRQGAVRVRRGAAIMALVLASLGVAALVSGMWMMSGRPGERGPVQLLASNPVTRDWVTALAGRADPSVLGGGTAFARLYLFPWAAIALASAAALELTRRRRAWAVPVLVVVVGADLLAFGHGFNPGIPAAWTYPRTPALEELRRVAGDGRVLVLDWGMPPDLATYYGLDDVIGYDAIGRARLEGLMTLAGPFQPGPLHFRLGLFDRYDSPVIDLLGVRAVASTRNLQSPGLRLVHRIGRTNIYQNIRAFARAFVPSEVVLVRDLEQAHETALRTHPDPTATALVEAPPATDLRAGAGTVGWRRLEPGSIELNAAMGRPGIVVVSEAYDPGWHAEVDGRPGPVYPCDLALMAIPVPGGSHRVTLHYRPRLWPLAVVLSSLGAVVSGVGLAWPRRKRLIPRTP